MNRAMPTATGTAMIRASTAAKTVPKISGPVYASSDGASAGAPSPVIASRDCRLRKTATAASVRKMSRPEPTLRVAKTVSPARRPDPDAMATRDAGFFEASIALTGCLPG